MDDELDTSKVKHWRSIVTLIVFVLTNVIVLFPFDVPLLIPTTLWNRCADALSFLRLIPPREANVQHAKFRRVRFPLNFVTAPLIADLFLLAILAIGRQEVHDGTLGADNIKPIDIMAFFISLAYIALSIDASGLIRFLALKVLQKGGKNGRRLFLYLYVFFFALASVIGNDPIVLSGTPFLAYMTRMSSNIEHARAWVFTQFAVANIASAILVSSNPTNLVLAGAFEVKFIHYTANMIVPAIVTALLLFPFLLFICFREQRLIPSKISLYELPEDRKNKAPVNPNIPPPRFLDLSGQDGVEDDEQRKLDSLQEVMNPYLDKPSAIFSSSIMIITLIVILVINATAPSGEEHPVFWVSVPAAVVTLCWDLAMGWRSRHTTRRIAREPSKPVAGTSDTSQANSEPCKPTSVGRDIAFTEDSEKIVVAPESTSREQRPIELETLPSLAQNEPTSLGDTVHGPRKNVDVITSPKTLHSIVCDSRRYLQETYPTAMTVLSHLPLKLVPFAFCMFVLVQALVTSGWVPVFAYGWDHWVNATGTVGAIGGMGFVSVILCNFSGTNIGTTILLCRVIQAWIEIHRRNNDPVSQRTFWATVYSMAVGVNYGAFSIALSASLAGLLWRDILSRKGIAVSSLEFARVNIRIIAAAMAVGCAVLVGEVYLFRSREAYHGVE